MMRISYFILFLLASLCNVTAQPQVYTEGQLGNQRVWNARMNSDEKLKQAFLLANLQYPPRFVYWRVFKKEKQMELWASDSSC